MIRKQTKLQKIEAELFALPPCKQLSISQKPPQPEIQSIYSAATAEALLLFCTKGNNGAGFE